MTNLRRPTVPRIVRTVRLGESVPNVSRTETFHATVRTIPRYVTIAQRSMYVLIAETMNRTGCQKTPLRTSGIVNRALTPTVHGAETLPIVPARIATRANGLPRVLRAVRLGITITRLVVTVTRANPETWNWTYLPGTAGTNRKIPVRFRQSPATVHITVRIVGSIAVCEPGTRQILGLLTGGFIWRFRFCRVGSHLPGVCPAVRA